MNNSFTTFCFALCMILLPCAEINGQTSYKQPADSIQRWLAHRMHPLAIQNYGGFIAQLKPLLNDLGKARIVGLGEGTHGTSEFQTLRTWISRYLCEERGFSVICLENSYGCCAELNEYLQTGEGDLDTLMRGQLLGMWQNQEIKEWLQWIRQYNQTHASKIHIAGMDHSATAPNARIIRRYLEKLPGSDTVLLPASDSLLAAAGWLDEAYESLNHRGAAPRSQELSAHFAAAYRFTQRIKTGLSSLPASAKKALSDAEWKSLRTALYNSENAYSTVIRPQGAQPPFTRDKAMAAMVRRLSEDHDSAKVIVWAHQAHLAKQSIFGNAPADSVTGAWLNAWYPQRYVVAGTGTYAGTCSKTTDRFIVAGSRFQSYALSKPKSGSWEHRIMSLSKDPVYIDVMKREAPLPPLPLRFTGYRKATLSSEMYDVSLPQLFDLFFFIPYTTATHMLW